MNQDQPSPDRAAVEQMIEVDTLVANMLTNRPDEHNWQKAFNAYRDAMLAMLDERTRATNIRQIENWRDWIERREDLQWLVKDMNEAIAALKDTAQTDANGVWLEALSKGADKDASKHYKPIPTFANEQEEREFWDTHDSTEYLDWSKAKRRSRD